MERITIYENLNTGEVLTNHADAMEQFRHGDRIKVYYNTNPTNFIIWEH